MIALTPFKLVGLKDQDITIDIDNIIKLSKNYLVIAGYSFTKPTTINSVLNQIINSSTPVKHCIMPINLFGGKDVNRSIAIELIKKGVSVSIEPNNHSKWLLSENEIYFGSANFTRTSLKHRYEVVSFKDFSADDPLKKDFIDFTIKSMKRMRSNASRSKINGQIVKNQKLVSINSKKIKRLNPSIVKVKDTLKSINSVQLSIIKHLADNYWLLSNNDYNSLTRHSSFLLKLIDNIGISGSRIILQKERNKDISRLTDIYNDNCDRFQSEFIQYKIKSDNLIEAVKEVPTWSISNKKLISFNLKGLE